MKIKVDDVEIWSKPDVKYLGVSIDKDLKMTVHIKKVVDRAATIQNSLSKIMPRHGGITQGKRRVLATVVQSVSLYAAPVWEDVLRHKKYRNLLRSTERKVSISVICAYRTASTDAAGAIARYPPYDLLAWERAQNWRERGSRAKENREEMMRRWQLRWQEYAGCAKTFVKDVKQ